MRTKATKRMTADQWVDLDRGVKRIVAAHERVKATPVPEAVEHFLDALDRRRRTGAAVAAKTAREVVAGSGPVQGDIDTLLTAVSGGVADGVGLAAEAFAEMCRTEMRITDPADVLELAVLLMRAVGSNADRPPS